MSNTYDVETLQAVWDESGVKPDIVQNRWHQGNGWDKSVVSFCKESSIHYEYVASTPYLSGLKTNNQRDDFLPSPKVVLDTDGISKNP